MASHRPPIVLALTGALLLLVPACEPSRSAGHHTVTGATPCEDPQKVPLPPDADNYEVMGVQKGLRNYVVKYDDRVYRGGEPLGDAAAQVLHGWGIHTIISITPTENERSFCKRHGFTLVEIPFPKSTGPTVEDLKLFLHTVETQPGPFYLHCNGGTHRGGVLGVAYRACLLGWPLDQALVEYGRLGGDLLSDHSMLEAIRCEPQ